MIKKIITLTTATSFIFFGEILILKKISLSNVVSFDEKIQVTQFEIAQASNQDWRNNKVCGATTLIGTDGVSFVRVIPSGDSVIISGHAVSTWKDKVIRVPLSSLTYPQLINHQGTAGYIEPTQLCSILPPQPRR